MSVFQNCPKFLENSNKFFKIFLNFYKLFTSFQVNACISITVNGKFAKPQCVQFNFCELYNPKFKTNPFILNILKSTKAYAKDIFVPCPYPVGLKKLLDYKIKKEFLQFAPKGTWKILMSMFNEQYPNLAKIQVYYGNMWGSVKYGSWES